MRRHQASALAPVLDECKPLPLTTSVSVFLGGFLVGGCLRGGFFLGPFFASDVSGTGTFVTRSVTATGVTSSGSGRCLATSV